MADKQALVSRLATASPLLKGALEEHLADYDELLAHVYFGDVSRAVEAVLVGDSHDQKLLTDVVSILEDHLAEADEDSENVIAVSFVENFCDPALMRRLRPHLGPRLSRFADELCGA